MPPRLRSNFSIDLRPRPVLYNSRGPDSSNCSDSWCPNFPFDLPLPTDLDLVFPLPNPLGLPWPAAPTRNASLSSTSAMAPDSPDAARGD